jgi:hypothetical protein
VFLGVVFHLEAKIIKFKVGYGVFLCQCAKAFPGNIMVFVETLLKANLLPRSPLALRSASYSFYESLGYTRTLLPMLTRIGVLFKKKKELRLYLQIE